MDSSRRNFNQHNSDVVTTLHPSKIPHLGRVEQLRQEDKWIRNCVRIRPIDIPIESSKMKATSQMTRFSIFRNNSIFPYLQSHTMKFSRSFKQVKWDKIRMIHLSILPNSSRIQQIQYEEKWIADALEIL